MKTEGFIWILRYLKESVFRGSMYCEINPDYGKQQIILTDDVMEKIDIHFNELINDMEGDDR